MHKSLPAFLLIATAFCTAQDINDQLAGLTKTHNYVLKRSSSYDRTGGNADARPAPPGSSITVLDEKGPGEISHIWFTIADHEQYHLKKIVLRIYWDDEKMPSVEAPIGDFFGLGNGEYFWYQSAPLAVGADKALNCFFPMAFRKHARITVSNEGEQKIDALYWNVDWRAYSSVLSAETMYFHAQYRQAKPNVAIPDAKVNLDGRYNYVWMEA